MCDINGVGDVPTSLKGIKTMKVKVEFTVEVDKKVLQRYLDDLGTDETIREFVNSYMIAGMQMLDESIEASIGDSHTTYLV